MSTKKLLEKKRCFPFIPFPHYASHLFVILHLISIVISLSLIYNSVDNNSLLNETDCRSLCNKKRHYRLMVNNFIVIPVDSWHSPSTKQKRHLQKSHNSDKTDAFPRNVLSNLNILVATFVTFVATESLLSSHFREIWCKNSSLIDFSEKNFLSPYWNGLSPHVANG